MIADNRPGIQRLYLKATRRNVGGLLPIDSSYRRGGNFRHFSAKNFKNLIYIYKIR